MRLTHALPLPLVALVMAGAALTGCGTSAESAAPRTAVTVTAPAPAPAPAPAESNPAGDIPDNQAYVAYRSDRGGFTVKVPEGWSRTDSADGGVSFTDKLNRIEIAGGPATAAPTPQSVNAAVVPALRRQVPGFTVGVLSTVSRPAGPAVLLTYQGDGPADSVTGKAVRDSFERYAFFKNGHEAVLTLSGPVGADNVDPWRTVTDSLRWQ
ncbi:hypothetical protein ACFXDJ_02165 [Streptomyces sp. NPDC059443]|uniref:hypothetical protein n=1 Tax=unclassified Streptomyces TaxID=2593676 RepID=UPI00369014CD